MIIDVKKTLAVICVFDQISLLVGDERIALSMEQAKELAENLYNAIIHAEKYTGAPND